VYWIHEFLVNVHLQYNGWKSVIQKLHFTFSFKSFLHFQVYIHKCVHILQQNVWAAYKCNHTIITYNNIVQLYETYASYWGGESSWLLICPLTSELEISSVPVNSNLRTTPYIKYVTITYILNSDKLSTRQISIILFKPVKKSQPNLLSW